MMESQDGPVQSESQSFALFGFLWAIALLSHQLFYRDAFRSVFDVALTASALLVLLRPFSVWLLLAATSFHVLAVFDHLPAVLHHWFFAGLVSLAFVVIAARVFLRDRRLEPDTLFLSFAPVARLNLICLYYLSAFHKLNSDYFSLDGSCGVYTYGQLREALPFLPASTAALWVATYSGVILELALPSLLIARRWRRPAVVLGLFFHLSLGLMGYPRFSAISFALLILFLPELDSTVKKGILLLNQSAAQPILSWLRDRAWLLLGAAFAVGVILPNTTADARAFAGRLGDLSNRFSFLFFLLESAVLIVAALSALRRNRFSNAPIVAWLPAEKSGLFATALLILAGLAPYLGLQTLNTFSMYSNVRTEGGSTNHFVAPAGLQIFSYQQDLVDIVETNIAPLQRIVESDMLLPYQQLRVAVTKEMQQGTKGIRIVFIRNGETISVSNAEDHPQLGEPLNVAAYKLLNFRAIEKSGARACTF